MGAIKDIVDLTTQLSSSVQDRKLATEILKIQTLILSVQREDAELVTENLNLKKKTLELEKGHAEEISNLKKKIFELENKFSAIKLQDKYNFNSTYGVYESKESGHHFCTSCLMKNIESPLTEKQNGWQCELKDCNKFYSNSSYCPPPQEPYDPFEHL